MIEHFNHNPLLGVYLKGYIYRTDNEPLDSNEFFDKFIDFIEENDWQFAGNTKQVDLNKEQR